MVVKTLVASVLAVLVAGCVAIPLPTAVTTQIVAEKTDRHLAIVETARNQREFGVIAEGPKVSYDDAAYAFYIRSDTQAKRTALPFLSSKRSHWSVWSIDRSDEWIAANAMTDENRKDVVVYVFDSSGMVLKKRILTFTGQSTTYAGISYAPQTKTLTAKTESEEKTYSVETDTLSVRRAHR